MRKKLIIIGKGSIGNQHYRRLLLSFGEENIYHIGAREFLSHNFSNYFDFGIIASPASMHIEHFEKLREICNKILIEKPLSNKLVSKEFIEQIDKKDSYYVGYCMRFNPVITKLKDFLTKKVVGEVFNANFSVGSNLKNWRNIEYKKSVSANKKLGGGVLLELSHEIDLINLLFGEVTVRHANIRNTGTLSINVEEIADIIFTTVENQIIYLHQDFLSSPPHRNIEIFGEKGSIFCDLISKKIKLKYSDDKESKNLDFSKDADMYDEMFDNFFSTKLNNGLATLNDGCEVLDIINSVRILSSEN